MTGEGEKGRIGKGRGLGLEGGVELFEIYHERGNVVRLREGTNKNERIK